jgi:uncharacterized membrane protein
MLQLILGLVLFLGSHSVSIVAKPWRDAMVAKLGEWPWKGLYSVVSLLGLVLIVRGYGEARLDPMVLYSPPSWTHHIAMLLMLLAFPAAVASVVPGRIQRALKHPLLVAVKAWALAHLLVNGTLAAVLLFGGFLAWAVADRISLKRRVQGPTPGLPASAANDFIVVGLGLALYVAFLFWLHGVLFGIPLITR